jgi:ubiquinone/menaquinone biosynthesis C-methylase UbiE
MEIDVPGFDKITREVFAPVYPVIAEQIKHKAGITSGTCLDIGCGGGYLGIAMAGITELQVYLFDNSMEMLEIAARNIAGQGIAVRVQTLLGDVHDIPLSDCSVDLAISRGSVFFWDNLPKAFKEIYRVLKPGGSAFIGGGFGTLELKTQIFCEMNKRDSEWRKKNQNHTSDESLEKLKQSLGQAQIPSFEIDRHEAGMWMIIRKEACHEM